MEHEIHLSGRTLCSGSKHTYDKGRKDHARYARQRIDAVPQQLHHQFVASAKAVQVGHAIDADNKIGRMIASAATYPHTCDPADILAAEHKRQENAYYCGDAQVFYTPTGETGLGTEKRGGLHMITDTIRALCGQAVRRDYWD